MQRLECGPGLGGWGDAPVIVLPALDLGALHLENVIRRSAGEMVARCEFGEPDIGDVARELEVGDADRNDSGDRFGEQFAGDAIPVVGGNQRPVQPRPAQCRVDLRPQEADEDVLLFGHTRL